MQKTTARIQKPKPCRQCKTPTTNKVGLRILCDVECAIKFGKSEAERKQLKQKAEVRKSERKELAERKKAIKPLSKWLQEAQIAFNAYIRARDASAPCISCRGATSAKQNAGHYRTVAAASHLRFSEQNCHKQCEHCNSFLSGNIINYRPNLILKIGIESVVALENDNRPKKWSIEEVAAIKQEYAAKCRELQKQG